MYTYKMTDSRKRRDEIFAKGHGILKIFDPAK